MQEEVKMTGLDTGFFVELLRGNPKAITVWKAIVDGTEDASTSCLTIFELKRLALKGTLKTDEVETAVQAIFAVGKVAWIDSTDVCERASRLSHGLGIPAIDALILAGLLDSGAQEIYTTDSDFETYKKDGVVIKRL